VKKFGFDLDSESVESVDIEGVLFPVGVGKAVLRHQTPHLPGRCCLPRADPLLTERDFVRASFRGNLPGCERGQMAAESRTWLSADVVRENILVRSKPRAIKSFRGASSVAT